MVKNTCNKYFQALLLVYKPVTTQNINVQMTIHGKQRRAKSTVMRLFSKVLEKTVPRKRCVRFSKIWDYFLATFLSLSSDFYKWDLATLACLYS